MILALAESQHKRPEEEINYVANVIAENTHEEAARNGFVDLAIQLILEQPFKIVHVAGVLLVLNGLKGSTEPGIDSKGGGGEIVKDVIAKASSALERGIAKGEWRDVKLLLKFLGSLHGVFADEGVWPILEDLFSRAVDLQTASSDDVSRDSDLEALLVLIYAADIRNRTGQGHSIHDSLYHGFFCYGL